jgi:hypothetical protein
VKTIRWRSLVEGFLRGRYSLAGLVRVLALPVLIGATLVVVGWLLVPWLTIPRISSDGPVVRNGVAAVMVCGEKRLSGGLDAAHFERLEKATRYAPEPRTGTWGHEERGTCTIFYHHPPGFEQRFNRQERASQQSPSQFERLPVVEKLP